mgnify:CR=1 FL=1
MRDGHVGRNVRHRRVDQVAVELAELLRIVAASLSSVCAIFRIAQHGDEHFVELKIAAAGIGERTHGLAIGLAEIVEERIEFRDTPARSIGVRIAAGRRAPTAPGS